MFEMFALLINLLILTNSDAMVTCYLFSFYVYVWSSPTQMITHHHLLHCIFKNMLTEFVARICCDYFPQDFSVGICRRNLPWLFAAKICRRILPWKFAAGICSGNVPQKFAVAICCGFFVFLSKSFFVYASKSCLYRSKPFWCLSKMFLFVRFSLLAVFLFVIAVVVMGHRKNGTV